MYVVTIFRIDDFRHLPIISPSFEALYITNHLFPYGLSSSDESSDELKLSMIVIEFN